MCCRRLQLARRTLNQTKQRQPRRCGKTETQGYADEQRQCRENVASLDQCLERQPRNEEQQHYNGVGKSARDEQIDEWRRPKEAPLRSARIERALRAPPRPWQPGERTERTEPIAGAPANNPTI